MDPNRGIPPRISGKEAAGTETAAEFRTADAADLPFADGTFDLVFGRFLLARVPEPEAVVREYRRVARDGALVLVQEPDFQSLVSHPPADVLEKSRELAGRLFDTEMGRKCWHLLRDAGVSDLRIRAEVPVEAGPGQRTLRDQSVRSISAIGPALVQQGIETVAEREERMEEVRSTLAEDERYLMYYSVVPVAGRA